MARPPGLPGVDWDPRTGEIWPDKDTQVCPDCGKEKMTDDLVTDARDSDEICPSCAVLRVIATLSPGDVKQLLSDASAKIVNGRT